MIGQNDLWSIFQALPGNYIILLPDAPKFTIVAFNDKRAAETFTRQDHIGRGIFEAFPDNPDDPEANGVAMLTASLETVLRTKHAHQMTVQKYDIPKADGRGFEMRYWLPVNIPVMNAEGEVGYIIHAAEDVTARITAEKRENTARENFEGFFNQAPTPFAVLTGQEFRFSYANPAYIELMNHRHLVGRVLADAIPELEGQPFMQLIKNVLDTGQPYHGVEVPATAHFQGEAATTTRYFNLSYTPYRDVDGKVNAVLANAFDVSEQVALRERDHVNKLNQHAYDLFMQAPVGICILMGDDHRIVLANEPMLEMWGRQAPVLEKPLLEELPELERQGFIELLNEVKRTGQPFHANEHMAQLMRGGKKEEVYINFVYQPYYDQDGRINGILVIAAEVTEQVLSRKKIEDAEETTRLALESGDLGAYEIDLVTDEMITSARFNAIWGVDHAAARSEYSAAIHDEDKPVRLKAHEQSLKTGKLQYEARVIWKDGSTHWVRVNGTILFDIDRKPRRLLGVIQDISDQRAFAEEMERLVSERTAELEMANLQLEQTNKELEQFASITSHDLQEPLRKIQVFNSMLINGGGLTEQARIYADKIASAAQRMGGLIKDLLEYSRLTQNGAEITDVDLNGLLQLVLSDFELLIAQKGATIKMGHLETIKAIALQINQLFFNLIGNALKFSKPDVPPVVTISGSYLNEADKAKEYPDLQRERAYYRIAITDNVIGFEQSYADRIFLDFQRLNNQTDYGGYGIGLALCSKVVANHGGKIKAEGRVGEGATFTVVLPVNLKG
jgi:PAS domain S-box-containing protein